MRFENGARGHLLNSTIAIGQDNGLAIRVIGEKGSLHWHQEQPEHLYHTRPKEPTIRLVRGGTGADVDAYLPRVPAGHPEGYLEAFSNIYIEIADLIFDPGASLPVPLLQDGYRGTLFMEAVLKSSQSEAALVALEETPT
jgi:predicted dehydrogenase